MNSCIKTVFLSLSVLALGLAGCSGGGSGPSSGAGAAPAAVKMVTGVAATGAPVAGVVYLLDSSSSPVTKTTSTASDGSFSFDATGLTPPFLIKTSASGKNMYSLATDFGITNVTPLTSMALAQAAGGADLDALFNNHVQADISAAAAKLPDAVTAVQTALAPLMNQYSVGSMNFLNAPFSANHSGLDALLDAISVSIANGTVTIMSKQSNSVVFTAPSKNIGAGSVNMTAMPSPASSNSSSSTSPLAGGTPVSPSASSSGVALYTTQCAGCHGDIATTSLRGVATVAAIQNAIGSNFGGMSTYSGMSAADMQSISDALMGTSISPAPTPAPPSTTGSTPDGAALYAADCAGCHGVLASSAKGGATLAQIQAGISSVSGMSSLSTLTSTQLQAIVTALAGVTPAPTPPPACGSCHAIPPATGHHSTHRSEGIACSKCHGTGYSNTTVNAATHNNGVKDIVTTIGWNPTKRTCSNSCHGTHTW